MYAAAFSSSGDPVARPRISGEAKNLMMPRYSSLLMPAPNRPAASPIKSPTGSASRGRILLIEQRRDLHFAALVVSLGGGGLRGLLVVQLAVDDLANVRPRIVAD